MKDVDFFLFASLGNRGKLIASEKAKVLLCTIYIIKLFTNVAIYSKENIIGYISYIDLDGEEGKPVYLGLNKSH